MREVNRNVLILFEIEGLSGEEVATLTGMKISTFWVRVHRAREEFSRLARKLIPGVVDEFEPSPDRRREDR